MKLQLLRTAALCLLIALPSLAGAQPWSDNFDSYPNGSGLHGQGGWRGWGGNPAADAFVTNVQSLSAPQSAEITPTSDIVQQFAGANSGLWVISAWQYIPSGSTGEQYFILLNTYTEPGPWNWSLDMLFDSSAGLVSDLDDPAATPLPIVFDAWVEVRDEIDLTTDVQSIYYNGTLLNQKSWTDGASGGGAVNIEALDLFSNGGSSIYWDDCDLNQGGVPVEPTSWGSIKSSFR